jgi:solute carrier family 35, member E3
MSYHLQEEPDAGIWVRSVSGFQGWTLLAIGPFVDLAITQNWVLHYEMNVPALVQLLLSCAVAVLVNISQFMCLGRFSAVTFQVTGHAKTVLVLLGSVLFLHEVIGGRQIVGMTMAVAGMIAYGYVSSNNQKPSSIKAPLSKA